MSTKVESQAMLNTTMKDAGSIMKQVVAPDLSGFKAPFSERRIFLISGDAGLVMIVGFVVFGVLMAGAEFTLQIHRFY